MSDRLDERISMWVAGLQVDAQRLILAAKPESPEKKLATEVLAHIAEWKAARGLQKNYRPGGTDPDPD